MARFKRHAIVLNSIGSSFVSNEFDKTIMQHLKTDLSENAYTQLFYAMCFNCNTSIPCSFCFTPEGNYQHYFSTNFGPR